jgi:hypothetical protein
MLVRLRFMGFRSDAEGGMGIVRLTTPVPAAGQHDRHVEQIN